MLFKNSVRTSKRTPHFTITKINCLTLFKFNTVISLYKRCSIYMQNLHRYSILYFDIVSIHCSKWDLFCIFLWTANHGERGSLVGATIRYWCSCTDRHSIVTFTVDHTLVMISTLVDSIPWILEQDATNDFSGVWDLQINFTYALHKSTRCLF
jgi:hypothetical protein